MPASPAPGRAPAGSGEGGRPEAEDLQVERRMGRTVARLRRLVRQPSISATGEGLEECAGLVARTLEEAGVEATVLEAPGAPPAVYGEVASRSNPGRTLLFYNHYDVQPPDPLGEWKRPPFGGRLEGGRVHGRGASDDKGELVSRLAAVEALLRARGDLPCNAKFFIEGEEETGSAHVRRYLAGHRRRLACDAIVWEFGYVDPRGRPVVSLGMKGLLFAELSARGPARDAHSSLAPIVANPAWRLVEALSSLRDGAGRILVRGWHDEARPLGRAAARMLREEPFDGEALRRGLGLPAAAARGSGGGMADKAALAAAPTCNIAGIHSGYGGPGAKTVLPARAEAKVDMRLVPGMDPRRQAARLRLHLEERGFADVRVRIHKGLAAWRTDPADPFVRIVRDAAASPAAYGAPPVMSASSAGTGPMHPFATMLGAPCVAVGCTHVFAGIHGPNEYVSTALVGAAARCMWRIMDGVGRG